MEYKFNDKSYFLWVSGDGGDVAIDDTSTPGMSIRYTSAQFILAFNRSFWDSKNENLGFVFVGLNPAAGSSSFLLNMARLPQHQEGKENRVIDSLRLVMKPAASFCAALATTHRVATTGTSSESSRNVNRVTLPTSGGNR